MTTAPCLILAPPRSCTSSIAAALGQHPGLHGFPELNLFVTDTLGELLALDDQEAARSGEPLTYVSGLVRAVAQVERAFEALNRAAAFALAHEWLRLRAAWSTLQVLDHLCGRLGDRIAIDKSPRTVRMAGALPRAFAYHDDTRFIHLVRDPFATMASMLRTTRGLARLQESAGSFGPEGFALHLWVHFHRIIGEAPREIDPRRWMRVRAEDVLAMPRERLADIAQWLGQPVAPQDVDAMLHPERSPYANLLLTPAGKDNELGFLRAPGLRQAPVTPLEVPAGLDAPYWIIDDALALAASFDYAMA